ncbi:hypothetical protein MMAD_44850 [Mycolicibacterium madagascariense]|uniref:Uncharacterized protein n=1 Tax=Mycolicibacterium madagascariense TaxID=212765 RepID=A0A7I7XLV0_9MYCO|nr:hypothetical protein [Mycolicibacterium madagascariense]MCV7012510.1 hypothetical protein [Mycolicibacterium madagascariense]BBZ30190.1 hypothetical protein MMAD_44850 [Mycolicibacterium madagascariense]
MAIVTGQDRSKRPSVHDVFGDSLPETTKDEWDEPAAHRESDREQWLRDNVPPHHD